MAPHLRLSPEAGRLRLVRGPRLAHCRFYCLLAKDGASQPPPDLPSGGEHVHLWVDAAAAPGHGRELPGPGAGAGACTRVCACARPA